VEREPLRERALGQEQLAGFEIYRPI